MSVIAVWELLHETGLAPQPRLVSYSMVMAAGVSLWSYFGCPPLWAFCALLVYFLLLFGELLAAHAKLAFSALGAGGAGVPLGTGANSADGVWKILYHDDLYPGLHG